MSNTQPQQPTVKKQTPTFDNEAAQQIAHIANRLKLIEERLGSLRNHLDIVEQSVVEKYKSNITEIRNMESQMKDVRTSIGAITDMTERIAKRLDAFASNEEVKVLQRYVDLWQPMKFVTRAEVTKIVTQMLEQQSTKKIK